MCSMTLTSELQQHVAQVEAIYVTLLQLCIPVTVTQSTDECEHYLV